MAVRRSLGWAFTRKRWIQGVNPAGSIGSDQAELREISVLECGWPGVCNGAALAASDMGRGFPQKII